MTVNIKQVIETATRQIEAIEDKADFPVPGDFDASVHALVFQAGVEAMRTEAAKVLQVGGFNGLKNTINDIVV